MDYKFQEQLIEFGKMETQNENEKRQKFHEIMIGLMEQDELFVILSPDTTEEDFDNDSGSPRFAPNDQKRPSLWFFSSEENAIKFIEMTDFYIKKDDVSIKEKPLYKKVGTNQAANIVYMGIFNGVTDVVVDESFIKIIFNATDFINLAFVSQKKKPLFSAEDATFLELVNVMKMCGLKCLTIADKGTPPHAIMSKNFKSDTSGDIIKIFDEKEDAEKYARETNGHTMFAVETDIITFANMLINMIEDKKEYQLEMHKMGSIFNIPYSKAMFLLKEMSVISQKDEE